MTTYNRKVEAVCADCGRDFSRGADEKWKTLCVECWAERQPATCPRNERARVLRELAGRIYDLTILCAPRFHDDDNRECAEEVSEWLQDVHHRLKEGGLS